MAAETSILVNGNITMRQLYNALERVGIHSSLSVETLTNSMKKADFNSMFIPIMVDGLQRGLFIKFYDYYEFKSTLRKELPLNSRKLKNVSGNILYISAKHEVLAENMLRNLAHDLGGGYIKLNDSGEGRTKVYQTIR